jgi:hypothetical protein
MWSMGAFVRAAAVAASACLVLAATVDAPAGDSAPPPKPLWSETAKALGRFPEDLAALAAWCDQAGLAVERNRVAETILLFSPDDATARNWLGFKGEGEGKWKRVPTPPPLDSNKDALAEWTSRRDALVAPFRGTLLAMATAPNPRIAGIRDRVLRSLVALAPEDREFRVLNGETYAGGRWVLNETVATAEGRRRIADAARQLLAAALRTKLQETPELTVFVFADCGIDAEGLDFRFRRWLRETK